MYMTYGGLEIGKWADVENKTQLQCTTLYYIVHVHYMYMYLYYVCNTYTCICTCTLYIMYRHITGIEELKADWIYMYMYIHIWHTQTVKATEIDLILAVMVGSEAVLFHREMMSSVGLMDITTPHISSPTMNCSPRIASNWWRRVEQHMYTNSCSYFHFQVYLVW